jgi:hypothetical protein
MAGPGLFALRLKLPKGYHIPPHTHPKPEVVTILSPPIEVRKATHYGAAGRLIGSNSRTEGQ